MSQSKIVTLELELDKETKTKYRYVIDSEESDGISGTLYLPKEDGKPTRLQAKVKITY